MEQNHQKNTWVTCKHFSWTVSKKSKELISVEKCLAILYCLVVCWYMLCSFTSVWNTNPVCTEHPFQKFWPQCSSFTCTMAETFIFAPFAVLTSVYTWNPRSLLQHHKTNGQVSVPRWHSTTVHWSGSKWVGCRTEIVDARSESSSCVEAASVARSAHL